MSRPHPADSLSLVLLVVLLALFGTTLRDYGPSWDEEAQATYGDRLLHYYGSGFRDEASLEYRDLYLYGGFFEVLAQGATKVLPFGTYESRHVANGVFGLLGILAVWLSGRRLGGPTAGFLAALLLAATPRYYGHILVNPKDIPFAALAALYVDSALAALATLPEVSARSVVRLGVT